MVCWVFGCADDPVGGPEHVKDAPDTTVTTIPDPVDLPEVIDHLEHDPLAEDSTFAALHYSEIGSSQLANIRSKCRRINERREWTAELVLELWESTEGGHAYYFLDGDHIDKIVERHFGEMGQSVSEYFFQNDTILFCFSKHYAYNRPIYWDSARAAGDGDNEFFDFEKSEIEEERNYFQAGRLSRRLESGDCGAPFATAYLMEQQTYILDRVKTLKDKLSHHRKIGNERTNP